MRLATLLLLLLALVAGCASATGDGGQVDHNGISYPVADRKKVDPVAGEDLLDAGKQLSSADYAGDIVVVNVWGSWCGPCRFEAPELVDAYRQTKDLGVHFLGVDVRDNTRSAAQDFVRDRAVDYPSIYDPAGRSLLALNGVRDVSVPTTVVLDRQHRVAKVYFGGLLAADLVPYLTTVVSER